MCLSGAYHCPFKVKKHARTGKIKQKRMREEYKFAGGGEEE
jgi:hypothetical protein